MFNLTSLLALLCLFSQPPGCFTDEYSSLLFQMKKLRDYMASLQLHSGEGQLETRSPDFKFSLFSSTFLKPQRSLACSHCSENWGAVGSGCGLRRATRPALCGAAHKAPGGVPQGRRLGFLTSYKSYWFTTLPEF